MRNQDPKAFPNPEDKGAKVEGFDPTPLASADGRSRPDTKARARSRSTGRSWRTTKFGARRFPTKRVPSPAGYPPWHVD
jgi:hypothetical protein